MHSGQASINMSVNLSLSKSTSEVWFFWDFSWSNQSSHRIIDHWCKWCKHVHQKGLSRSLIVSLYMFVFTFNVYVAVVCHHFMVPELFFVSCEHLDEPVGTLQGFALSTTRMVSFRYDGWKCPPEGMANKRNGQVSWLRITRVHWSKPAVLVDQCCCKSQHRTLLSYSWSRWYLHADVLI